MPVTFCEVGQPSIPFVNEQKVGRPPKSFCDRFFVLRSVANGVGLATCETRSTILSKGGAPGVFETVFLDPPPRP